MGILKRDSQFVFDGGRYNNESEVLKSSWQNDKRWRYFHDIGAYSSKPSAELFQRMKVR
jgi:hypothetical protein